MARRYTILCSVPKTQCTLSWTVGGRKIGRGRQGARKEGGLVGGSKGRWGRREGGNKRRDGGREGGREGEQVRAREGWMKR